MNVSEWVGLGGLVLGVGGVAINIGVTKARVAASERRLDQLEAVRDRMGGQLHSARAEIKVLRAVVEERSGNRRNTLSAIGAGDEGAPSAEQLGEDSGGKP